MNLCFIVGFNVVLCVLLVLAAFREEYKIRDIDMNKDYNPDTWSIFNMFKSRLKKLRKGLHYYYITK